MKYTYEVITLINLNDESIEYLIRTDSDGNSVTIPADLANSDYQLYLKTINDEPATQSK